MGKRLVYGTQTCIARVGEGGRLLDVCGPLGMDRCWVSVGVWVVGVGWVCGNILVGGLGVGPDRLTKTCTRNRDTERIRYLFNGRGVVGWEMRSANI